jgi:hypothetical protein
VGSWEMVLGEFLNDLSVLSGDAPCRTHFASGKLKGVAKACFHDFVGQTSVICCRARATTAMSTTCAACASFVPALSLLFAESSVLPVMKLVAQDAALLTRPEQHRRQNEHPSRPGRGRLSPQANAASTGRREFA